MWRHFFSHSNGNSNEWLCVLPMGKNSSGPSTFSDMTIRFILSNKIVRSKSSGFFFFLSTLLFRHKHVNNRSPSKNVTKMFGLVWGTSLTERRDPFENFFRRLKEIGRKSFDDGKHLRETGGSGLLFLSYCKCVVRPPRESKRFCVSSPNRRQSCRGAAEIKIQT